MMNGKPLVIDGYCGLGGWSEGFLAEGWECVGIDIEKHDYGTGGYPGHLMLQDMLTVDGARFKDADCLVFSPPCQKYSYTAMPWTRAKKLAEWYRESPVRIAELNALFDACFRIQLEASKAAGRYIPMVIENVKGAQPWVGSAKWHYGSFYLWGDVPALMPSTKAIKRAGPNFHAHENGLGSSPSFNGGDHETRGTKVGGAAGDDWFTHHNRPEFLERAGVKVPDHTLNKVEGKQSVGFNVMAVRQMKEAVKNNGNGTWFGVSHGVEYPGQPGNARDGVKQAGISGVRANGKGDRWYQDGVARSGSKSTARKQASAMIAKIPFTLAQYIARVYKPAPLT